MMLMCDKRVATLQKFAVKPQRPVQSVQPEPAVPRQPLGGAPHPNRAVLKKAYTVPKVSSFFPIACYSCDVTMNS